MEKEAVKEAVRDNQLWSDYFKSIKTVCPWSYAAWQKGKIQIVEYKGSISNLDNLEARVYCLDRNPRQLKKLEQRYNNQRDTEEWLHSHPSFGVNSTPVPVLIQQHRLGLEQARKSQINTNPSI